MYSDLACAIKRDWLRESGTRLNIIDVVLMQEIGDLLKDWRRINVSFTRAKSKLVIFGSKKTLEGDKLLRSFMDLMKSKDWIYRLPKGAELVHDGQPISISPIKSSPQTPKSSRSLEARPKGSTKAKGQSQVRGKGMLSEWLTSQPFAKDILAVSGTCTPGHMDHADQSGYCLT